MSWKKSLLSAAVWLNRYLPDFLLLSSGFSESAQPNAKKIAFLSFLSIKKVKLVDKYTA
jgi:hypothetical protein